MLRKDFKLTLLNLALWLLTWFLSLFSLMKKVTKKIKCSV